MSGIRFCALVFAVLLVPACATTDGPRGIQEARTAQSTVITFDRNRGELNSIYSEFLGRNPQLGGRVVLRVVIAPDGHVVRSDIAQSTITDSGFLTALRTAVASFDFGPVRQPGNMAISYPIEFYPIPAALPMPTNPRPIGR